MRERQKVTRELPCELTARDKQEYGMKLAKEIDAAAKAKAMIKFHQKEVERLVSVLIEGFEVRSVQCQEIPDYSAGVMNMCRLDNYETLSSREMTDEERNGNLFAGIRETEAPKAETTEASGETISEQEPAPAPEDLNQIRDAEVVQEGIGESPTPASGGEEPAAQTEVA